MEPKVITNPKGSENKSVITKILQLSKKLSDSRLMIKEISFISLLPLYTSGGTEDHPLPLVYFFIFQKSIRLILIRTYQPKQS